MKSRLLCLAVIFSLLAAALTPVAAIAAKGTPNSPDFGYGARIDLAGKYIPEAFQAAARQKMDWIAIDFDWAARWPVSGNQPPLQDIDQAMGIAGKYGLAVLVRIQNAPGWARTDQGPDGSLTSWLAVSLSKRYAGIVQAIELFPGANLQQGWGSPPNPEKYADLLKLTDSALQSAHLQVHLIAGGLTPLGAGHPSQDMDDLQFLQGLYDAGAAGFMPIVSICLPQVTGTPLQVPDKKEHRILRHYEEVRRVMLTNNHLQGMVWITNFSWPSGRIQSSDSTYDQQDQQASWLNQAYRQLRAQLYIGAAFYSPLNPGQTNTSASLIRADASHHPFFDLLGKLIAQNNQHLDAAYEFDEPQIKNIIKTRS